MSGERDAQAFEGGDCFGARNSSASSTRAVESAKSRSFKFGATSTTSSVGAGDDAQLRRDAWTGQWRSPSASSKRVAPPRCSPDSLLVESSSGAPSAAPGRAGTPPPSSSVRVPCSQQTPWRSRVRWTNPSNCKPTRRTDRPRGVRLLQRVGSLRWQGCSVRRGLNDRVLVHASPPLQPSDSASRRQTTCGNSFELPNALRITSPGVTLAFAWEL